MSTIQKTAAILISAAVLAAFGVVPASSMSADEIKQTISGKSGTWESGDHSVKGTIKWAPDGTQKMTSNIPGIPSDTGKWRVKGAKLCSKWTKIRDGAEKCEAFEALGGKSYKHGNSTIKVN